MVSLCDFCWNTISIGWQLVRHSHADANWLTGDCLALNSESKNEKGSGSGSSYVQNLGYYTKHWAKSTRKAVMNKSLCPTILIEITGPEISSLHKSS